VSLPAQGDIIAFKPELDAKGHEQQGSRPWLVVSVKPYNDASKLVMVCPITSHQGTATTANAAEVLLPANCGATGVVLTFQLQTIDWQARKAKLLGSVPVATLKAVQRNLKMCLEM
jgi:mRNA-degrading endonuclease toxin of MazEF toxin-antitoxin module